MAVPDGVPVAMAWYSNIEAWTKYLSFSNLFSKTHKPLEYFVHESRVDSHHWLRSWPDAEETKTRIANAYMRQPTTI